MIKSRDLDSNAIEIRLIDSTKIKGLEAMTFPIYRSFLYQSNHPHMRIIGGFIEDSVVTLLLAIKVSDEAWEIISLFTCRAWRGQGYAKLVVTFLCECLRNEGQKKCIVKYMTNKENTSTLERIFDSLGFEPALPRQFMIRSPLSQIQKAPWTKLFKERLPNGFSIKYWYDVSQEERDALRQAIIHETWVPKDLIPFDFESNYAKTLSLALLLDGAVVGWSITHLLDAKTLRFTNLYIKESLQIRCQFIALVNHTMELMSQEGVLYSSWAVSVEYQKTIAFYQKHLIPYCNWTGYSVSRSIEIK